jgi:predicted transglutaminase-like cysteine proteinase
LLQILLLIMAGILMLPPNPVAAFDVTQLQATLRKLGGNPQALIDWQQLLQESKALPVPARLKRVNEFFNRRIRFGSDQEIWHQSDYWATPMETLSKGAGDCEDFTIAKYFTLLNADIPVEQLRLIYVKARIGGMNSNLQQAHMVLAYYASPDSEPLVLDNLITDIRPASRRTDLSPVFSFNSQGIFNGVDAKTTPEKGGVTQLSRWSELLQRARAEGFN